MRSLSFDSSRRRFLSRAFNADFFRRDIPEPETFLRLRFPRLEEDDCSSILESVDSLPFVDCDFSPVKGCSDGDVLCSLMELDCNGGPNIKLPIQNQMDHGMKLRVSIPQREFARPKYLGFLEDLDPRYSSYISSCLSSCDIKFTSDFVRIVREMQQMT